MAVFSNDPRAQQLWSRVQKLNRVTATPCKEGKGTGQIAGLVDICGTDDKKRERLGYSCLANTTVTDCQDYNRNVKAKAQTSAELEKYLKDTAKAKADKDKKAAEVAAEQAILARRRASDASLESAVKTACVSTMNVGEPRRTAILDACSKASENLRKKKSNWESTSVTFDEVARELATSKASGKAVKKPAKLKAKAKAKAKAAAKLKKRNR